MIKLFSKNIYIYVIIFLIFLIGIYTYKDYGVGIEEHFHRKSGFYWLNFLLNFTDFEFIKKTTEIKLEEIKNFTPRLFPIENFGFYGILFDVPLAFIEVFFEINEPKNYFYLRHFSVFMLFLTSAFLFYKIILFRFNNVYLALFGFLIFVFTPRIYGNIFFDNKDIFYLSILTINMFFLIRYLNNKTSLNLIFFSIFCAFSTSSRIIGLLIPISFFFILFFEYLSFRKSNFFFKRIFIFLLFYLVALIIHWPYLWTLNIHTLHNFFDPFFYAMNPVVYFNGDFFQSKYLPYSYLPIWIFISTPVFLFLLFIFGFFSCFRRIFFRLISIKEDAKIISNDLWKSKNENFDVYISILFLLTIIIYFSINPALLSGWRHFYFLNFFMVFFACYLINAVNLKSKKKPFFKIFLFILFFFSSFTIYDLYKYHPFQSVYFNKLVSDIKKYQFEIDTQSLSRVHAIKELLKEDGELIIGTASWTPLEDARSMISKKHWERLNFVGTEFEKANFIYSNYYYEVNTNYNKKYVIPQNFSLYKTLIIDGTRIYSIYKKNI